MCGIAGYIGNRPLEPKALESTLQRMIPRGPDYQAAVSFHRAEAYVHLLHSRLSIIDLDPRSHQPFSLDGYTLVYNGELYNYLEIRQELEKKGICFQTASDTEVLLRAFIEEGERCLDRFEGMWSFAIYHEPSGKLWLSRDRFAEKPLYYLKTETGFYFGSEVKFISALLGKSLQPNRKQLLRYLTNGYKSLYKTEETFFEGVRELSYASIAQLGQNFVPEIKQYWIPKFIPREMTLLEAIDGTRARLSHSLKLRLRADVPLAFCLSGGVDSSALVSLAVKQFGCRVATFSIVDSDPRYNEADLIRATVDDLGCENTQIHLQREGGLERLKDLIAYHDAPVATISYYIHSFLSQAISQAGYRVSFSGTAADELFTGYYDHFNLHLNEVREGAQYSQHLAAWREGIGKYVRNPHLIDPELYAKNPNFREHIYLKNEVYQSYLLEDFSEEFGEEAFTPSLMRNRMLNELFHEATRVILHEDDLNSMKYSVENRSPYLDRELFEFAYSIPSELLIQKGYAKYVLREAVKGILNDRVRLNVQKKGFNASIQSVFDFSDPKFLDCLLSDGPIYRVIDKAPIRRLAEQATLSNSDSKFLFSVLNAKLFLELFEANN